MTNATNATNGETFALEARAEEIVYLSGDRRVRRGESDRLEVGSGPAYDVVSGTERARIGGHLSEHTGGNLSTKASRIETTVEGKLTQRFKSDTTLLGGTMTETYTGGLVIGAGMSDDLIIGGGVRVTAPADMWLCGLVGMEEKLGSAYADGALVELYRLAFEREYKTGLHLAGAAVLSGMVHTTTATGFRQYFKVAIGVRDLTPGGDADAKESEAPAPTAAPAPAPAPPPGEEAASGGLLMAQGATEMEDMEDLAALEDIRHLFGDFDTTVDSGQTANRAALLEDLGSLAKHSETGEDVGDAGRLTNRLQDGAGLSDVVDAEDLRMSLGLGQGPETVDEARLVPDELVDSQVLDEDGNWVDSVGGDEPAYSRLWDTDNVGTDEPAYSRLWDTDNVGTDEPAYSRLWDTDNVDTDEPAYSRLWDTDNVGTDEPAYSRLWDTDTIDPEDTTYSRLSNTDSAGTDESDHSRLSDVVIGTSEQPDLLGNSDDVGINALFTDPDDATYYDTGNAALRGQLDISSAQLSLEDADDSVYSYVRVSDSQSRTGPDVPGSGPTHQPTPPELPPRKLPDGFNQREAMTDLDNIIENLMEQIEVAELNVADSEELRTLQEDVDIYMLARAAIARGEDPCIALHNAFMNGSISLDMQHRVQDAIEFLDTTYLTLEDADDAIYSYARLSDFPSRTGPDDPGSSYVPGSGSTHQSAPPELPPRKLPDDFNQRDALTDLDNIIENLMEQIEVAELDGADSEKLRTLQEDVDIYRLARAAIARGEDPCIVLHNAFMNGSASLDMQHRVQGAIEFLDTTFDLNPGGQAPEFV